MSQHPFVELRVDDWVDGWLRWEFMALQEIPLPLDPTPIPAEIQELIDEADRRADVFFNAGLGRRYPNYVPCDPKVVYTAMAFLKKEGHIQGDVFCEWGCGFAIAAGTAALMGMKAYGIEIESEIADRARQLTKDLNIPVEIILEDYLPEGFEESEGLGGKDLIAPEATTAGSWDLAPMYGDLDPSEVDLFFVYPWPGQEEMMMDLFAAMASHGAIFLIYLGDGEIEAYMQDESGE